MKKFIVSSLLLLASGIGLGQIVNPGGGGGGGSSTPTTLTGALADYTFLNGSGTTLSDISGNSNNATLGTAGLAPTWTTIGLQFTGQQQVSLPSALNGARTFYLAAYINPLPLTNAAYTANANQYPLLVSSSLGGNGINILTHVTNFDSKWIFSPELFSQNSFKTTAPNLLSGLCVLAITLGTGGGNVDHIYINGVEVNTYGVQGSSAGQQASGNLFLGSSNVSPFTSSGLVGTFYRAAFFTAEQTAAVIAANSQKILADISARGAALILQTPLTTAQLYAAGDSITYGYGTASPATMAWPANLSLTNQPSYTIFNAGLFGVSINEMSGSEINRIAQYCKAQTGPTTVIGFAGTNDLAVYSFSAATTMAKLAGWIQTLKSSGCLVYVGTMISRTGADSLKNSYDALILEQSVIAGADGVIDFAANPLMGADGAYANATYFSDNIHPTAAGQLLLATAASNTLNYYNGFTIANPNVVTTNTYQMLSGDGAITAAPTGTAAYTAPDCVGPSGVTYTISNPQTSFTLSVVGKAGQAINGLTTAITIPSRSTATLLVVPEPKTTSGCHWTATIQPFSSITDNGTVAVTTEPLYSVNGNQLNGTTATSISSTSFVTTGIAFPPTYATTARNYRGYCHVAWSQATAANSIQLGINTSAAPVHMSLYAFTAASTGTLQMTGTGTTDITTATTTSATGAVNALAANTRYMTDIWVTLAAGAAANTVTLYGLTTTGADALLIEPGTFCTWLP